MSGSLLIEKLIELFYIKAYPSTMFIPILTNYIISRNMHVAILNKFVEFGFIDWKDVYHIIVKVNLKLVQMWHKTRDIQRG